MKGLSGVSARHREEPGEEDLDLLGAKEKEIPKTRHSRKRSSAATTLSGDHGTGERSEEGSTGFTPGEGEGGGGVSGLICGGADRRHGRAKEARDGEQLVQRRNPRGAQQASLPAKEKEEEEADRRHDRARWPSSPPILPHAAEKGELKGRRDHQGYFGQNSPLT